MNIELADEEAVLLDGKVGAAAQSVVDAAKARLASAVAHPDLSPQHAGFIADVVTEAHRELLLTFRAKQIRYCRLCERKADYYLRARSSRSGRKGTPDYSKPRTFSGVELHDGFVSIENHVSLGCCLDCFNLLKPFLAKALDVVKAQIPKQITDHSPIYQRTKKMHCKKCEWIGLESEMGMLPAMIQGYYPGKCPSCGVENSLFTHNIVTAEPLEYAVVPATTAKGNQP